MVLNASLRNVFVFFLFLLTTPAICQQPETPVEHMEYLEEIEINLQKKYLTYMSIIAHSNSARKMEKKRSELLTAIQEGMQSVSRLRPFKGDASLKNTYGAYLKILNNVFREDYHKIVDMEAIAEQSYDNMEAYLLAQEKASEKLREASEKIGPAYKTFAENHNVRLTDSHKENKLSKKLQTVGQVNKYYHAIYLIFFKNAHQEGYLMKAMEANDLNSFEQTRNALIKYSSEGLAKLDTMKPFKEDASLVAACRRVLEFYKTESNVKLPAITNAMLKKDEFDKIKKAMDAKPERQRTQQDIDQYNKAVEGMNAGAQQYNKVIQDLNTERTKVIDNWNNVVRKFMDHHIPTAK